MRDVLEPIFGGGGALVVQFIITLLVVLALIAVVVWLVSRYGGTRVAGQNRNARAPRLALVDALPIDGRRRLVLVRRDNIEHLLLIGGPSDLVVEPAINRAIPAGARPKQGQPQPRPQGQAPTAQPAAAQPAAAQPTPSAPPPAQPPAPRRIESNGGSEPIPFPQPPRTQPVPTRSARPAPVAPIAPPQDEDVIIEPLRRGPNAVQASAHFTETARPTRIESVFSLAGALDEIADEADDSRTARERPQGDAVLITPPPAAAESGPPEPRVSVEEPAPPIALAETDESAPPETEADAARVSDLEREMARLLGEITGKRNG